MTNNNNNNDNRPSWEHDDFVHGWWIRNGRFLATEYPGHKDQDKALAKLQVLLDAGVNSFVDLTEPGEPTWDGSPMVPYNGLLGSDVRYKRFPIPDTKTITDAGYDEILAYINAELDAGRTVLTACWGGKGRTGTVVGSWLIETEGLGYPEVIDRMQELRAGTRKAHHPVPDTQEQHDVLRRRAERREAGKTWFERLVGFREDGYESTQRRLSVEGSELVSLVNGKRYGIGELTLPTLAELRARVNPARGQRSSLSGIVGEARRLHRDPRFEGALFQVASQFNVLEMVHERVTPEAGVTGYAGDPTQGPACAIAAGAATIYRNYFVPIGDGVGQTADRQVDNLAGLGAALSELIGLPVDRLWTMRNGYALATAEGLAAIGELLDRSTEDVRNELRGHLAIGLHRDVEVTDSDADPRPRVSQAFCSALPLLNPRLSNQLWEPFARLVLEATYEATLLAAAQQASKGGSNTVLLTTVGGGAFGNDPDWIRDAIERAMGVVEQAGLDVLIVGYYDISPNLQRMIDRWSGESA